MIWRDLMQVIVGELWDVRKHTWELDLESVLQSIINLKGADRTLRHAVELLFRQMTEKPVWGDSTPLNTVYFKELYPLFPKAKYIFLIRDGRDVVASYKRGGASSFGELAQIEESTSRWLLHARALRWYKRRAAVLEVKYEALMANPKQQLDRICAFLEVDPMPKNWEEYTRHIPQSEFFQPSHHDAVRQAPFTDSIGKWKAVLSDEEIRFCHERMGTQLKKYGYL